MNIGAMVERLIAAGAEPVAAAQIAAEIFAAGIQAAPSRIDVTENVSPGALRTRRWRERKASQNVTVTSHASQSVTPVPSPASPSSSSPTPPLTTTPSPSSSPREKHARGARLSAGWQPSKPQTAIDILGSPSAAQYELEKFRDHWAQASGANAVKRDWDAAWRNWCRTAVERRPRSATGPPRGAVRNGFAALAMEGLHDAADQGTDDHAAAGSDLFAASGGVVSHRSGP